MTIELTLRPALDAEVVAAVMTEACSPASATRFVLDEGGPAAPLFHQLVHAGGLSASQVPPVSRPCGTRPRPGPVAADPDRLGAERAVLAAYERAVIREKLTGFRRFVSGTDRPRAVAHPTGVSHLPVTPPRITQAA